MTSLRMNLKRQWALIDLVQGHQLSRCSRHSASERLVSTNCQIQQESVRGMCSTELYLIFFVHCKWTVSLHLFSHLYFWMESLHGIISPRHMREGYGSRSVCVCEYVCYRATCYIPRLHVSSVLLHGSMWCLKGMHWADFARNALFSSSAIIHV